MLNFLNLRAHATEASANDMQNTARLKDVTPRREGTGRSLVCCQHHSIHTPQLLSTQDGEAISACLPTIQGPPTPPENGNRQVQQPLCKPPSAGTSSEAVSIFGTLLYVSEVPSHLTYVLQVDPTTRAPALLVPTMNLTTNTSLAPVTSSSSSLVSSCGALVESQSSPEYYSTLDHPFCLCPSI